MKIIKVNKNNCSIVANNAAKVLNDSGIIIYPTDTCYGIGCLISSDKNINRVKRIKKRKKQEFPILVGSLNMAKKYGKINLKISKLVKFFMPGPLTIIVPKSNLVSKNIHKEFVGFRISKHYFILNLFKRIKVPLLSTSANISGGENPYSIEDIPLEIRKKVDLIIDSGKLRKKGASSVFHSINLRVIRTGPISERKIMKILNKNSESA